jgi:adenosylmethionine-8-amino-7-oxononanoate aminotransferase
MKDYASFPPLEVVGAEGSHLILKDGRKIIDAVSSWWCKSLGHGHPGLRDALIRQAGKFEHVISANTSTEVLVQLSEKLAELCPPLDKVFYGGDGSTAVEIALKLALHAQRVKGESHRTKFIALENGYHGESSLALAVSDLGLYREPYDSVLPEPSILLSLPYVSSSNDPLWSDCGEVWPVLEAQLQPWAGTAAALILEPVLQGAGGMKVYSPDLLRRLREWTRKHGVYLIADEILTGFWRTGEKLAVRHAGIAPDMLCLSKGLTGGWLPFSAVLIDPTIYDLFLSDYGQGRDFLHSNTYSGNALGAAVALEALRLYSEPEFPKTVSALSRKMATCWEQTVLATGAFENSRTLGTVVAADLKLPAELRGKRVGFQVYQEAMKQGALLRNLGNTVYWLPPLNSAPAVIEQLAEITAKSVLSVRQKLGF